MVARHKYKYQLEDFRQIAKRVRAIAPDIVPIVCRDRSYNRLRPQLRYRASFVVAPIEMTRLTNVPGAIAQGIQHPKSTEYRSLESIGVAVPEWELLSESHVQPTNDAFDKYVVVKPDFGGRGAEVKIKRSSRVRWKPPGNRLSVLREETGLLVQRFIYTGPWPISYRVTTLFGKPLLAWKVTADRQRRSLDGPDDFGSGGETGGGYSICSSGKGCQFELIDDTDILELASRAHQAFPDMPILGTDIIREHSTGKLFVIELNSGGGTWHLSSTPGKSIAREFNLDFHSQFGGLARVADVLIDETRRRAA
jgi:hypothetical protein